MNRLRILHLGKYYPPATGGIESHVRVLSRAQTDLGHAVSVLCFDHSGRTGVDATYRALHPTPGRSERDGGVEVLRLGRWASIARLDIAPRLPLDLNRLIRGGFDIVHLHAPNPA